jgi:hypothetical protein
MDIMVEITGVSRDVVVLVVVWVQGDIIRIMVKSCNELKQNRIYLIWASSIVNRHHLFFPYFLSVCSTLLL